MNQAWDWLPGRAQRDTWSTDALGSVLQGESHVEGPERTATEAVHLETSGWVEKLRQVGSTRGEDATGEKCGGHASSSRPVGMRPAPRAGVIPGERTVCLGLCGGMPLAARNRKTH